MSTIADTAVRFRAVAPACDYWTVRCMRQRTESLSVTRGRVDPVGIGDDFGVMVTVRANGAFGYAATSDVTDAGLARAGAEAKAWADRSAGRAISAPVPSQGPPAQFDNDPRVAQPWASVSRTDKLARLSNLAAALKADGRIVNWQAGIRHTEVENAIATSHGDFIRQCYCLIVPELEASASDGGETQTRTFGRGGHIRQGGLEVLDALGFWSAAPGLASEALQLLAAPDCPTGVMDLLIAPDQMYIQIHESIGHPLELDRILGDERNYAGTSFVTLDMFGSYQYGSDLLNVTFDPDIFGEAASYAFDDDATKAERAYLIRSGKLEHPLGGAVSQARAGLQGVANARACNWNRPTIDRMANLNIEPGSSSLEELIGQVEAGVMMETNCSWSIDDSRNKFQFGCELGRVIKNGELGAVVKNPNYRGISATFWRNLKGLGDASTVRVHGTPTCGKGEPNQAIHVGHATPPGLFSTVEVFGGG